MRLSFFTTIASAFLIALVMAGPAHAAIDVFQACGPGDKTAVCKAAACKPPAAGCQTLFGAGSLWNKVLNAVFIAVGGVSVLMVTIGGLRYTLSNGEPANLNTAKNTIIYSLVGVVVASMGSVIVNFVLTNF
ncbi:MAG TPA: hypothetical protein VNX65_02725 [Patescibacteria group bacterium]|jgi:hypothetical protein|nr:hypothetical protein [Patescibacteria group bacterium]